MWKPGAPVTGLRSTPRGGDGRLSRVSSLSLDSRSDPAVAGVAPLPAHLDVLLSHLREVVGGIARRAGELEQRLQAIGDHRLEVLGDGPVHAPWRRLGGARDPVQPRRVQAEDLPPAGLRQRRVAPFLLDVLGDLEPPESLDLPLVAAIPP